MNHESIKLLISSSIDGELVSHEADLVEEHLKSCAECRQFVSGLRAVRREIKSAATVDLPYAFAHATSRRVHRKEEYEVRWTSVETSAKHAFAVLALIVIVMAAMTSFNSQNQPMPVDHLLSSSGDSVANRLMFKQGEISKDDMIFAVVSK